MGISKYVTSTYWDFDKNILNDSLFLTTETRNEKIIYVTKWSLLNIYSALNFNTCGVYHGYFTPGISYID